MKDIISNFLRYASLATTLLGAAPALATEILDDPLHAFCYGGSSCSDNGIVTPTASNSPTFGFSISPGPQTGDFLVDLLIPTNDAPAPNALSFTIKATQGGGANNTSLSANSSLFSSTAWTSGDLVSYLGLTRATGAPPNPIGAWLPSTVAFDPGATGYYVYTFDLGTNQLEPNNNELLGPLLNFNGALLPEGALVVGFLGNNGKVISTAQSGALLIDSPVDVPEPASLSLFGAALIALGFGWRVKQNRTKAGERI